MIALLRKVLQIARVILKLLPIVIEVLDELSVKPTPTPPNVAPTDPSSVADSVSPS